MKIKTASLNAVSANPRSPTPIGPAQATRQEIKPLPAEVARKAYFIYLNQGCPQGQDVQHWLEAEAQTLSASGQSAIVL